MDLIVNIALSVMALTALEIVLGIDNLVFLSIIIDRLPETKRARARFWGLSFAWIGRVVLLVLSLGMVGLTQPILELYDLSFSIRDIFLLCGGGFLIIKTTQEIHDEINPIENTHKFKTQKKTFSMLKVITQIFFMDLIFSLDSVLTAVGLTNNFWVMFTGITIAILVMLSASSMVSRFIARHPAIKILVLSYLLLIGVLLIADGLSFHVPRGYLYCAMSFSLMVEMLKIYKGRKID